MAVNLFRFTDVVIKKNRNNDRDTIIKIICQFHIFPSSRLATLPINRLHL